MKLFKLVVSGSEQDFSIAYKTSSDFMNYSDCQYFGSEEERYISFLEDLKKNGGPQPVNIKVKLKTKTVDRAFPKDKVLSIESVGDFVSEL